MRKEIANRCIELLIELDKKVGINVDAKSLILELGYLIKQDGETNRNRGHYIALENDDPNKLYQENQQLICDNLRLKDMLASKIPAIEKSLNNIVNGYEAITSKIIEIREIQKTL